MRCVTAILTISALTFTPATLGRPQAKDKAHQYYSEIKVIPDPFNKVCFPQETDDDGFFMLLGMRGESPKTLFVQRYFNGVGDPVWELTKSSNANSWATDLTKINDPKSKLHWVFSINSETGRYRVTLSNKDNILFENGRCDDIIFDDAAGKK